jgi:decaprenylphospho-beta-D-ribofuranose 2-oxidase
MPLADTVLRSVPRPTALAGSTPAAVGGWGGGQTASVSLLRPRDLEQLSAIVAEHSRSRSGSPLSAGAIARGMGRSYGDAAQLAGGAVFDITGLKSLELDAADGVVTAQAGITIGELLAALAPQGWVVPVVPGTQHVTLGGAIASDIHGKNHGIAGTFGSHVQALGLLTAAGELQELVPGGSEGLFEATVGGMGLTGVIVWARVKLRPVQSELLSVDTDRVRQLDDAFAALRAPGGPHRVAWLDLLGSGLARGIVTRAEHLPSAGLTGARGSTTVASRLTVPASFPGGLVRAGTVRAYNEYRYRSSPRRQLGHVENFGSHMFPLDALDAWPRLYGRRGFLQYQFVVGPGGELTLQRVIERLRRSAVPCYLAILKDFGPANGAPLSFPVEGWTLALDLPRSASGLAALLNEFDELVVQAGGRVYLTKDIRLAPQTLAAMYPRLGEWRACRDKADPQGLWRSDLAVRTGLVSAGCR